MSVSDPDALMAPIDRANPNALIFGCDLPSTRATVPFASLVELTIKRAQSITQPVSRAS